MNPRRWHSPYKSFLLSIIIATSCLLSLPTYALNWFIVTSEADSGAGTLRDAIIQVNTGGTDSPNAIAFANNVQIIILQSNLPVITNPVLIDGLATANLANPQSTVEGNCTLAPSPIDVPQIFSDAIRVTIDGSNIQNAIDPNERWGLHFEQAATVRGIRVQNITAPGNGSYAAGIRFNADSVINVVECCEISQMQNTAFTTDNNGNRAVGVENEAPTSKTTLSKCYIHTIEGGSIAHCDGTLEALESGHAYGTLGCKSINTCRIECIISGSINASCNNDLRAVIGRAAGIATTLPRPDFPPNWPCDFNRTKADSCQLECNQACEEGTENPICMQNNIICNILGGSIVTDQPEVFLAEVVGILLGSPFSNNEILDKTILVQNNTIRSVQNGNATVSGDNAINIALGSFGVIVTAANQVENTIISCNAIDTIKTGATTVDGKNATTFTGYTYGIWNEEDGEGNLLLIECNNVSNISGAQATVSGACSVINDSINATCQFLEDRHTPGGAQCTTSNSPIIAGVITTNFASISSTANINKNEIENIQGGQRVAHGYQSSVFSMSTVGIYIQNNSGLITANKNSIKSIMGTELTAQPGSLSIIKQEGTTGLCIIGQSITATENTIEHVCEGRIQAAQSSLGVNLTTIFFGLLDKFCTATTKQLDFDTALPYAPVITSGISISRSQSSSLARTCTNQDPWCIADNAVSTVTGSAVTGGLQPLGSIATGIWLQPQFSSTSGSGQQNFRSFESCEESRQSNQTSGTAFNNTITHIAGGTNVPAYGIFLDGSAQFFQIIALSDNRASTFFTIDHNTITNICGSQTLPVFNVDLSALTGFCPGSTPNALERTAFPFLPFEPTSGIYTLFGGCSTLSSNTIQRAKAFKAEARGITTTASSDMLIVDNSCSELNGYGIFVGGAIATIDVAGDLGTDPSDLTFELFASVRNKIHTNSTFDNTNKGIKLGLVDWSNALFGLERLNVCPSNIGTYVPPAFFLRSSHNTETIPEDSIAIFGNHGQPEPHITKVVCNSNGTITIAIDFKNTHPLTDFIIQFFRNSTETVSCGEQAISDFDNTTFVFTTDFNGRAQKKFTFMPVKKIQSGDTITAHISVNDQRQAAITSTYFCDTSEFGGEVSGVACRPKILSHRPQSKPNTSGFAAFLHR